MHKSSCRRRLDGLVGSREFIVLLALLRWEKRMMDLKTQAKIRNEVIDYLYEAGIFLTEEEKKNKIQIVDYKTGDFYKMGLAKIPEGREKYYTCRHEVILNPGDQYTVGLNEKHWWQAGPDGVIALEVSSKSRDGFDLTTDDRLTTSIY